MNLAIAPISTRPTSLNKARRRFQRVHAEAMSDQITDAILVDHRPAQETDHDQEASGWLNEERERDLSGKCAWELYRSVISICSCSIPLLNAYA